MITAFSHIAFKLLSKRAQATPFNSMQSTLTVLYGTVSRTETLELQLSSTCQTCPAPQKCPDPLYIKAVLKTKSIHVLAGTPWVKR